MPNKDHPHRELAHQYAEDSLENWKAWEDWEFKSVYPWKGVWVTCKRPPTWNPNYMYRRKPKNSRDRFWEWMRGCSGYSETATQAELEMLWDAWKESERQALEIAKENQNA